MQERLFTIHQVADLLGVTPREVLQWVRQGWLASQSLPAGSVRISERALVQFLADRGIDIRDLMVSTSMRADEQGASRRAASAEHPEAPRPTPLLPGAPDAPPAGAAEEGTAAAAVREMLTGERALPPAVEEQAATEEAGAAEQGAEAEEDPSETAPEVAAGEVGPDEDTAEAAPQEAEETPAEAPEPQVADPPRAADADEPADVPPLGAAREEAAVSPAGEPFEPDESAGDSASQLADAILADAVARTASRIHLEAGPEGLTLRLRIDGVLHEKPNFPRRLPRGLGPRLIERLLQWAGVSEQDASGPRGGRFTHTVDGRPVTLGLSALPTTRGPRLVLDIHDREVPVAGLSQLPLPGPAQRQVREILSADGGGLVLVVGAGARATSPVLRALTVSLRDVGRCVLAIETAADVEIDGVSQSPIGPFEGYTFATAARALAAQDLDAVLIDQVRDPTTATAALEAALAGATVLGGLRAATAGTALGLLAEMELEPWPLASALKALLCARSVRRLCVECRKAIEMPEALPPEIGIPREALGPDLYEPVGCSRCGHTGYVGTIPLTSVVIPDAALRRLIRTRARVEALEAACRAAQAADLRRLAAQYLRDGVTSLEEVAAIL